MMKVDVGTELYRVTLTYACFGIIVNKDGFVVTTAPIGSWMNGKLLQAIQDWIWKKKGTIVKI